MSVETHRVARIASNIAFGAIDRHERRRMEHYHDGADEIREEFQIEVSGNSTGTVGSFMLDLDFQVIFPDAREHRDSPFIVPQFADGWEQLSGLGCILQASVRAWKREADDSIRGARVEIAVVRPGYSAPAPFTGYVHLTFAGWGFPVIPEGEDEL